MQTLNKDEYLKLRLTAFTIDFIIITLIITLPTAFSFRLISDYPDKQFLVFDLMLIIGIILFLLKDIVHGQSIGKWTIGLAVREYNNIEEKPKLSKLILRNVFTLIWPVEFLMILFAKEHRKIGDKLAITEVYRISDKVNVKRIVIISVLAIVIFVVTTFLGVITSLKGSSSYKVAIESIENNKSIQEIVGEIEGYGMMPSGSVSVGNGYGDASFVIKVKGEKRDLKVSVYLRKRPNKEWEVEKIDY